MHYIPNTDSDRKKMLESLGLSDTAQLFSDIPAELCRKEFNLPPALSDSETEKLLTQMSDENNAFKKPCFIGGGAYNHYVPSVIDAVLSRPEFYTAYTPYQPEVSQGTLQAIFEYQSMICSLTGMDICNASMYDGGSAMAEAALMAVRHGGKTNTILIADTVNPLYRQVLATYCNKENIVLLKSSNGVIQPDTIKAALTDDVGCVVMQSPNFFGFIENMPALAEITHTAKKASFVAVVNPLSLGVLEAPGVYGADIAVGEGQPLGIPLSYGGPYLGFLAVKQPFMRKIPGRLSGRAADKNGKDGFVLTLATREQHIRREKASSNICSNEALCALAAGVYMSTMGKTGISEVAELCLQKSHYLAEKIAGIEGFFIPDAPFFNEFAVITSKDGVEICNMLRKKGFIAGIPMKWFFNDPEYTNMITFAVTELNTKEEIDALVSALEECK